MRAQLWIINDHGEMRWLAGDHPTTDPEPPFEYRGMCELIDSRWEPARDAVINAWIAGQNPYPPQTVTVIGRVGTALKLEMKITVDDPDDLDMASMTERAEAAITAPHVKWAWEVAAGTADKPETAAESAPEEPKPAAPSPDPVVYVSPRAKEVYDALTRRWEKALAIEARTKFESRSSVTMGLIELREMGLAETKGKSRGALHRRSALKAELMVRKTPRVMGQRHLHPASYYLEVVQQLDHGDGATVQQIAGAAGVHARVVHEKLTLLFEEGKVGRRADGARWIYHAV